MKHVLLLLASLYIFVLLPSGRFISIASSSEAREIHIARTITETGDWLLPSRNGIPPSKPPLYHWVCASISKITGHPITPTITRGVNVVSSLIILIIVAWVGIRKKIFTSPTHIALFSLILTSTHIFLNSSIDSKVDMFAALWISSAVISFLTYNKPLFIVTLALALLSKGPVCGIVIALGMFSFIEWRREKFLTVARAWIFPSILGSLIGLSWYAALYFNGDHATLERQMFFENFNRFFGGEDVNYQPWWYYFSAFVSGSIPWAIIFIYSLFDKVNLSSFAKSSRLYFVIGLIFFSCASGKRASYLIPLMPWMSVYLTLYLKEAWLRLSDYSQGMILKSSKFLVFCLLVFFILLIPGMEFFSKVDFTSPSKHIASVWISYHKLNLALILCLGMACLFFIRKSILYSVLTVIFTGWTFGNATSEGIKAALKDFERAASSIKAHIGSSSLIVAKPRNDELLDPLMYYLDLPATVQNRIPAEGFVLMRASFMQDEKSKCNLIETYQQIPDREKNKTDRLIGLYQCGAEEIHTGGALQKEQ